MVLSTKIQNPEPLKPPIYLLHFSLPARIASFVLSGFTLLAQEFIDVLLWWHIRIWGR